MYVDIKYYYIRSRKVVLLSDAAELLEISQDKLVSIFNNRRDRFPDDFVFFPKASELLSVGLLPDKGNRIAFTLEGLVLMSCYVRTITATEISIQLVRVFAETARCASLPAKLSGRILNTERLCNLSYMPLFKCIKRLCRVQYMDKVADAPLSSNNLIC